MTYLFLAITHFIYVERLEELLMSVPGAAKQCLPIVSKVPDGVSDLYGMSPDRTRNHDRKKVHSRIESFLFPNTVFFIGVYLGKTYHNHHITVVLLKAVQRQENVLAKNWGISL